MVMFVNERIVKVLWTIRRIILEHAILYPVVVVVAIFGEDGLLNPRVTKQEEEIWCLHLHRYCLETNILK